MHFDFAAFLVVLTILTGVIWALDALFWAKRRHAQAVASGKPAREPVVVEYARSFFPVILAVLIIRSFLVEPFRIPSSSMMPTLLDGDFILVNKFTYGIRLPVINDKVIEIGDPKHGDVMVFRFPEDPSQDYIKRVVGLPGDQIDYRDKQLYVNNEAIAQLPLGLYTGPGEGGGRNLRVAEEALLGADHKILLNPARRDLNRGPWTVPEGHYFVLGDNRDNSRDSRFWGFVPDDHLVGRAFLVWMHWDASNVIGGLSRIGTSIE